MDDGSHPDILWFVELRYHLGLTKMNKDVEFTNGWRTPGSIAVFVWRAKCRHVGFKRQENRVHLTNCNLSRKIIVHFFGHVKENLYICLSIVTK